MDKEAATALARVQIAMWLPASCELCGHEYTDVDDFYERNPRAGDHWEERPGTSFIDDECYRKREAT